jgi:hypothetical protein
MERTMKRSLAVAFCLLGLLIAGPAYAQQPALQGAIKGYLSKQGPLNDKPAQVMADLDGDGQAEAIVTFCIDENAPGGKNAGASNPANVHCALAVFKQTGGQWGVVAQMNLGQGRLRGIAGGKITVETLTYRPSDPLCCPSQKRVGTFGLKDGKLVKVQ